MDCTCDPLKVVEVIRESGPNFIVVDETGTTKAYILAREEYDISWDIILIRSDGWTFSAPLDYTDALLGLCPDNWLGFVVDGSDTLHDMQRWPEREQLLDAAHRKDAK